jgi:hypothetical protein
MRGSLIAKLGQASREDERNNCDCGWPRPKFVDLRGPDKETLIEIPDFYLLFTCPICGAVWDAHYKQVD